MYNVLIEPMQKHINDGAAQIICFPTYGKALSVFKEICDSKGLDYDTYDQEDYPCEWIAGGVGYDYRITLIPDHHV
jgi:hypothetical protein